MGSSETASGETHAFLFHRGDMIDLGTLGGSLSVATAINEFGQIVGFSETETGAFHAVLWDGGVMKDLGPLTGNSFHVADINNLGLVVGMSGDRAVLWKRRLHIPEILHGGLLNFLGRR